MEKNRESQVEEFDLNETPLKFPLSKEKFDEVIAKYDKKLYDLQQMLEISRSLCTNLDLASLIQSVLYVVMAQMRVINGGIFILDAFDSGRYDLKNNHSGLEINPLLNYSFAGNSKLAEVLCNSGRTWSMDELKKELGDDRDAIVMESLHPSLIVPLILKNRLNGIMVLGERIAFGGETEYTKEEKDEVLTIASLSAIAVNNASLMEQTSTDMMTKLKLRFYFFNVLGDRLDYSLRHDRRLAVIMFDIDFFKNFNDTYGHACGDYVLIQVARILKENIRALDLACRYGGEEFTVMLPNTGKRDAIKVANRIRKNIEKFDFFYEDHHMNVTISGGVSVFSKKSNPINSGKILVDQADQALYISKRSGRNMITFAEPMEISAGGPM